MELVLRVQVGERSLVSLERIEGHCNQENPQELAPIQRTHLFQSFEGIANVLPVKEIGQNASATDFGDRALRRCRQPLDEERRKTCANRLLIGVANANPIDMPPN